MASFTCPICQSAIGDEKFIGTTIVCSCGWHGRGDHYRKRAKRKLRKWIEKSVLALALVAAAFCYSEWTHWGLFFSNHIFLQAKAIMGMANQEDWVELGIICNTLRRFGCSETAFTKVLKYDPENLVVVANLGIAQAELGKHSLALSNFRKIFAKGEGSADIMAYYGMSLESLGRLGEAENWYYRTLSAKPTLVDVANRLVDLLVKREAYIEALSVIGNVSALAPDAKEYFQSRLLAIGDLLTKTGAKSVVHEMRLASFQSHHFVPVQFAGMKIPAFFLVDTGATYLTLSPQFLEEQKIRDFTPIRNIEMRLGGGQTVQGTLVMLKTFRFGAWQMDNVQAAVCDGCLLLAGKSVLHHFEMSTREINGVEYLTLRH